MSAHASTALPPLVEGSPTLSRSIAAAGADRRRPTVALVHVEALERWRAYCAAQGFDGSTRAALGG